MTELTRVLLLILIGAVLAAFSHGNSSSSGCSGGGVLVIDPGTCSNVLTTAGGDPLTP